MDIYRTVQKQNVSNYQVLSEDVCVSVVEDLTLHEYCLAQIQYYNSNHRQPCSRCTPVVKSAQIVLEQGIISMSKLFKTAFPNVTYHSLQAKRRLLQMPLAAIRVKKIARYTK